MIEFKKLRALTMENSHKFSTYWIIKISSVLCIIHIVPRDQDKFMFYINNYID